METRSTQKHIRISPRKVKVVLDLIRGKDVGVAVGILKNTRKSASPEVLKLLTKCIADAAGTQLTYENPDDAEAAGYNLMSNSSLDSKKLESLGWAAEFSPEEGADRCDRFYG